MQLTVRGITGQTVAVLSLDPSQPVLEVKRALATAQGFPARVQKLLAGACILEDQQLLREALPAADAADITLLLATTWAADLAKDWTRLRKFPEEVRNDRELVGAAVEQSKGQALKYAGREARGDKGLVLRAMDFDPCLAQYASEDLGADMDFMLRMAARLGWVDPRCFLRVASRMGWQQRPELCGSRSFMAEVLAVDGWGLQHASAALRADWGLVLLALRQSCAALRFADEALREDETFLRRALELDARALEHASAALRGDRAFVEWAMREYQQQLEVRGEPAERAEELLGHASEALQRDHGFVLPLLQRSPEAFRCLCEGARGDRALAMAAVERAGGCWKHCAEELWEDRALAEAAARQEPKVFERLQACRCMRWCQAARRWHEVFAAEKELAARKGKGRPRAKAGKRAA